ARVTDGQLRLWTGSACTDITHVTVNFSPGNARLLLQAPAGRTADVEYVNVDGPNDGLDVREQLPDRLAWRTAGTAALTGDPTPVAGSTQTKVPEIVNGSADHPSDTYYFEGFGWLDPDQLAERDGKSLLGLCTPDPAKQPSLPPAFGARITDSMLRIWTGSP